MILLIALLGISSSVVSAEPLSGTADEVVWGPHAFQDTYVDIQLNGGRKLPGWCADDIRTINAGVNYTATIYDYFGDYYPGNLTGLPSWVKQHGYYHHSWTVDWNSIAYVINHKQGTWRDIQQALWYFSDDGSKPSSGSTARAMVDAAITYKNTYGPFVPGPGQLKPIICYVPRHQVVFYECQIPACISIEKVGILLLQANKINFTFNVTNTSKVTLTNVAVSDSPALDSPGLIPASVASLAPGTSAIFTGNHTLTAAEIEAGYASDTATATGTPPCGPVVTNTTTWGISLPAGPPPAPVPELPTIVLLSIGLVGLAGWFGVRRRKSRRQA